MFKHLMLMSMLLLIPLSAQAQEQTQPSPQPLSLSDVFSKLPGLKQGVAFDIEGHNTNYFTTIDVLQYKGFSLAAGYSSDSKVVASLDYDIGGLSKLGINVPLLNIIDLRVGFYAGFGNLSASNGDNRNKFAYGPEATVVSIKF